MYEDYVRHVVDETLEMFPGHYVSDADKDRIVKGFSRIESGGPEKSPVAVQMIQSVVIVKMMIAGEEST
jgi:hypothetical protein